MMKYFLLISFVFASGAWTVVLAEGVAAPVKRQEILKSATDLYAKKDGQVILPKEIVNPFVGVQIEDDVPAGPGVPAVSLDGNDLMAKLASQIPASGTANLGGEWILLMGQKRLKVGDSMRINFEGQSYELFIASIAATNFTVRRGEMLYTRPIR